jgi:hypothetical protein
MALSVAEVTAKDQRMKNQMATSTTAGIPNSQPMKYLPMLDLPFVTRGKEFRVSAFSKARARTPGPVHDGLEGKFKRPASPCAAKPAVI